MAKLLIVPGSCDALGGTLVTLALLLKGLQQVQGHDRVVVLVRRGSYMEGYLRDFGGGAFLELITAANQSYFFQAALDWVDRQPRNYPLLLDNCVERPLLGALTLWALRLRLSGRSCFHFCHDLARSHHPLGYFTRKLAFGLLKPKALCNSYFTSTQIHSLMPDIRGVMYQPVDLVRFNSNLSLPPLALQPILERKLPVMLTPSRLNKPGIVNDKNLRALPPILAHLKDLGHPHHGVVVGEDTSSDGSHTRDLLAVAERWGVANLFTVLPPTLAIADYYRFARVVVTLAPREPFGRTVVEALAVGTAVVGSSTGGIGEILGQVAPDWRVDPTDPRQAAETVVRIRQDPTTPQKLAHARRWVEQTCSTAVYARRMLELTGLMRPLLAGREP
ncbi:glycosyltransferase family 4 protein [Anthocerotibacter panamensis]|uniref:glycosyltransferase family 4 protein n=1 Tax=Anthocerotibacter panamensis TaxID=2857077 RepID=UPI001C4067E3|nr:glycosyltransferase family 4 protein [Anthocerotibacter panamensis]